MKTVFKIFFGIILSVVVLAVGCTALVSKGVSDSVDSVKAENAKSAISQAQFDAVKAGASRADVLTALKPAVPTTEDTSQYSDGTVATNLDCVYFNKQSDEVFTGLYQFCFTDDKLTSKSSV